MTGLFGRWFQRRPPVQDRVWADTGASAAGLRRQVVQGLAAGSAVLLLVRTRTDREDLAHELAAHAPLVGGDRFATDDLRRHLRTPAALGVACVDDLRDTGVTTASGNPAPLQVHVLGRGTRRGDDRRLTDLLDRWVPSVIVFHHSLDDALLRAHAGTLQPLLHKLGMRSDEAIASPFLTRAIERAQRP
jgi:hypothetical protein